MEEGEKKKKKVHQRLEKGEVEEEGEEADSPIPIDRGWAWMVVVGCFGMHVLVVGGVKSFGVLFVELQQLYAVSARQLGLVQGLASVLMMALGPVSNALSVHFSCRAVVFTGGLLIGCGFVSSAFVPSFPWLYLTYSTLTGLGSGLAYAPSVVMVGHHFTKRRALANGISVSGSAVGSFLLPNLMRFLLNQYGLRGALATIGAIMFHVCACAALFRPLDSYRRPTQLEPQPQSSLNEEDVSHCIPVEERVSSCVLEDDVVDDLCDEEHKVSPQEENKNNGVSPMLSGCRDLYNDLTDPTVDNFGSRADEGVTIDHIAAAPHSPDREYKEQNPTTPTSPDIERLADNNNSPDIERLADNNNSSDFVRGQNIDTNPNRGDRELSKEESIPNRASDTSPDFHRTDDTDRTSDLERAQNSESASVGDEGEGNTVPHLGRLDDLRQDFGQERSEHTRKRLTKAGSCPQSPLISHGQGRRDGPTSDLSAPSVDADNQDTEVITANSILHSLEKKLARNASMNSMITHFGSMKHTPRNQERTGSLKFNFRRDSSKSKSGSVKRRAFKGGKPILERHPSALWDTRLPESLKQAIEEEKKKPQRGESIELALLTKNMEGGDKAPLQRTGSKNESTKRIGSFKAIDAAKPIRFSQGRKKLLLANNLRYMSETRDVGVATPTLMANEKAPLKRFYSVEAGNQPSPVLHDSFLHRRIRQISEMDSWRSESSVFASAGDLALASLQNISASVQEVDEDQFSTTSRTSGIKGLLRLSAQTVHKGEKKQTSVPLFDCSLMLNPVFLVFFLSLVCMNFGYPNIFVMLPSFCQEVGLDKTTAAFMVSIIGLTDLVGRLFIGWFSDLRLFPRKYGFMVSLGVAGLLCTTLPRMKTFQGLLAFSCGFGFCGGCFIALIAVILVDFLGKERLATSFGLASLAMAVGIMAGPAIYGDIRDTGGSWDVAFIVAGLMSMAAASCIFMEPLARHVFSRPIKMAPREVRDEML